jgi:MFS family permease
MTSRPAEPTSSVGVAAQKTPGSVQGFPVWPLLATLAVQTLATAAAYSIPAVAPAVASKLGINPALVGLFISTVYGVGILSALLSPAAIHVVGAVRVSQGVLVATVAMIVTAATGSVWTIAISAMLMGLAYGATAPASTHLLVPRTPSHAMNVTLSLRQIGVPLGGVLAGLVMPPLTLWWGWQTALLLQLVPILVLGGLLEIAHWRWEAGQRTVATTSRVPGDTARRLLEPLRLFRELKGLGPLLFASFVYSGMQLCFIVFMTTQLTVVVGFDLVRAGQALAAYQISGVVSRPIWGWLADKAIAARWLLALQGAIMCGAAIIAGQYGPGTSAMLVLPVCIVAGATASGFTGIAYAEYARIGGARRTEATGLGAACMFAGVMTLPALMSLMVTTTGSYGIAYSAVGLLSLLAGLLLTFGRARL